MVSTITSSPGSYIEVKQIYPLHLIKQGKIEGKRDAGKAQITWLKKIKEWTGIKTTEWFFKQTEDRKALSRVIAETGHGT